MQIVLQTIKEGEYVIKIEPDMDVEDPRESFDNLGTMVCFHSRYTLGDKDTGFDVNNYHGSWSALEKDIRRREEIAVILPIYMYVHSSVALATTPFHCPWDSGQIGFISVSKQRARSEFGRLTRKKLEHIVLILDEEVKTYSQFVGGDVYGYVIEDKQGNSVSSCWGFYGEDDCIEQAKAEVRRLMVSSEKVSG